MAEAANQIFLPWVQPGVAATIPDGATDRLTANQPSVVALPVRVFVNAEPPVEKTARLYGPGDVTGIDPQQIVRVEPRPGTMDFEPNYFPAVEFDRPDFPWLFTPAKAGAQARLRPWLCLVVVRKQPGVELRPVGGLPLPVLEIKDPARPGAELPDLAESHLWAHSQITGAARSQLRTALATDPARSVSRLLCPRRLDPATDYLACVVPAFDVGRKAGLGQSIAPADETKLAPAWPSGSQAPAAIILPVYYSWEFRTGAAGDFEALVRRLEPRKLPAEVGKRPMDIGHPGFPAPGATLGLEGALRPVDSRPDPWPDPARRPFQNALGKILNAPAELAAGAAPGADPVVAPPIYGSWHAALHRVAASAPPSWPPPFWLDELNLDPRHRVTAALGTQVIQREQEALMASAWEQLGEIQRINQRLRQAQLSRAVNNVYLARSFRRFSPDAFFQVVAPAQSRVVLEMRFPDQPSTAPPVKTLLAQQIAGSSVPASVVSAPLRRISRSRGTINRQYARAGTAAVGAMLRLFDGAQPATVTAPARDKGAVTIDAVSESIAAGIQSSGGLLWNPFPPAHWERPRATLIQMLGLFRLSNLSGSAVSSRQPTPATPAAFYEAAKAHHNYLSRTFTSSIAPFPPRPALRAAEVRNAVLASLDPDRTVRDSVLASFTIGSPAPQTGDPLEPILDAPTFPQPMYEALRDLSPDALFPGLERVPPNTVQLLRTNARFIEAFLIGLNVEMGRELLWRGYPTDQRGTYFQRFWDRVAEGASSPTDITPLHGWGQRALGATAVLGGDDKLVLLIRGDLLRRYPNTVIYAVKAVGSGARRELSTDPNDESHPLFRGTLEPDVTFVGFDLRRADVVAGAGWYFVLQQQPTEPRFGLDEAPFANGGSGTIPPLRTWSDLSWAHLAPSAAELKQLSHVRVNRPAPPQPARTTKGTWGRNSAHMAYITRQQPARVAIHATELLPFKFQQGQLLVGIVEVLSDGPIQVRARVTAQGLGPGEIVEPGDIGPVLVQFGEGGRTVAASPAPGTTGEWIARGSAPGGSLHGSTLRITVSASGTAFPKTGAATAEIRIGEPFATE